MLAACRTSQNEARHKAVQCFFMYAGHSSTKLEEPICSFFEQISPRSGKFDRLLMPIQLSAFMIIR